DTPLPSGVTRIVCDHTDDSAVASACKRVSEECGRLDILENSAWGGYERMVEHGRFTWGAPFWEQPLWRWHAMMTAGVRAAFVASQLAAAMMGPRKMGIFEKIYFVGSQY